MFIKLWEVAPGADDSAWRAIVSYLKTGMTELAAATQRSYRNAGERMLHHFGHFRIDEVEPTHCAQFLEWSKGNKRSVAGNRDKAFMSSVWEHALRNGWASYNPWRGVRRNKERPNRTYVEHETLVAELDRAPPELLPLFAVAYLQGIRQTDLRRAQKHQIEHNVPRHVIRDGRTVTIRITVLKLTESKTGKENEHEVTPTVALFLKKAAEHSEAVAARYEASAARLESWSQFKKAAKRRALAVAVRNSPYIFLSKKGRPWSEWGLASALRRFGAAFKFRQLRPKAQTDVPEKDILGHTGQMRERYHKKRKLAAVK